MIYVLILITEPELSIEKKKDKENLEIDLLLLLFIVGCCLSQQEDLQEGQKYSGVTSRNSDVGLVVIRDVSVMMPIHQSLGQTYT